MKNDFYRAFEDRYRGSRELIKSRLQVYRPFVEPLLAIQEDPRAIDLGCGRGEWLELLREIGFNAAGIDLDEDMLRGCEELGLTVTKGDAVALLATLPDESQVVVSAFHVVEHISFERLQTVVAEALRVLKPGGLLIMETPNPENVVVAACDFYVDPTHQRPIPPQLLSFLPEYHGFARVKTMRLQESKDLIDSLSLSLHDVMRGVSPDYAIIAQKAATDIFRKMDSIFDQEYGLSLTKLSTRYAEQLDSKFQRLDSRLQQVDSRLQQVDSRLQQVDSRLQQVDSRLQHAEARAQQAESRVETLLNSTSWRWTAPLRWVSWHMRPLREKNLPGHAKAFAKHRSGKAVRRAMVFLDTKPRLRALCMRVAKKIGITSYLRALFFGISSLAPATSEIHDTVPASIRMMLDVDMAIRTADADTSIIYLETR